MLDFPDADLAHLAKLSDMADVSSFPEAAPLGLQAVGGVAGGLDIKNPTTIWLWRDVARNRWRFDRKAATS
jgi:hypothetical protein